jgi:tol-pal system protein YbgF
MRQILSRLALLLVATTGCWASKGDVQLLQQDLVVMRTESARSDSVMRAQLQLVTTTLAASADSMKVLSARMARLSGELQSDLYSMGQQLVQIQELTGQSQRRLQEVRASLEQRGTSIAVAGTVDAGGQPGPNQLFQLALDQLRRGSTGTARSAFGDLLRKYPEADIAGEAQFYVGESWRMEGNTIAADSAYLIVVAKYPKSPRAPTALYKYAQSLEAAGDLPRARSFLELIVKEYPRSDEAVLARERLRAPAPK